MKKYRALESIDHQRLAEMWCELNRWDWPNECGKPEIRDYGEGGNLRRREFMHEIVDRIGFKACLREWNRDMENDVFEDFWRSRQHKLTRDAKA